MESSSLHVCHDGNCLDLFGVSNLMSLVRHENTVCSLSRLTEKNEKYVIN